MTQGVDRSGRRIQAMFGAVAHRYDLLNHLLSANLDVVWRRRAVRALELPAEAPVLDLCCGTGDQALALARCGYRVTAADFCLPMLAIARRKAAARAGASCAAVAADALAVPLRSGFFAAATVSFGLRNVANLDLALAEIHRVLAPGGRFAVLEFAMPRRQPVKGLYQLYFRHLLPRVGGLVSGVGSAYSYLPASVGDFPQRDEMISRLAAAGFSRGRWRDLTGGITCLYTAQKT